MKRRKHHKKPAGPPTPAPGPRESGRGPLSIGDLRPEEHRSKDPFAGSWLIRKGDEEKTFLPVCSFGDVTAAIVVLFLEDLVVEDLGSTSNERFWSPWVDRAMLFAEFVAGEPKAAGAMQPCVLWRIRGGHFLGGPVASPEAMRRMPDYPGAGAMVEEMIARILVKETVSRFAEEAHRQAKREGQEVFHRSARGGVPHREGGRRQVAGGRR